MVEMKPSIVEHIKNYPVRYGIGWIAILGVLAWLFQSWPGGFWGWLEIAWGWLRKTPNGYESASTTIRNLGLFLAAPFALWFAYWRARVADRQAKAAQEQVATSQRQVETSQYSLLNERYQKGAEMLGSGVLSVRLGGIYGLARLAREHPDEYHVELMRLLCAFVRNPPSIKMESEDAKREIEKVGEKKSELRPDIQAAMTAIGERNESRIALERQVHFRLDLRTANLSGLILPNSNLSYVLLAGADLSNSLLGGGNLSSVELTRANLKNVHLHLANLRGAWLNEIDLSNAKFWNTNLSSAQLWRANLSNAILDKTNLSNVTGLTQAQLNEAIADPSSPPNLDDAFDAETGEQLVWNSGPLDNDE